MSFRLSTALFCISLFSGVHASDGHLKVVSYNVLADAYAGQSRYPRVSPRTLSWNNRKQALVAHFLSLSPDVLCLQEVESAAFDDFKHQLGPKGYYGVYAKKKGKPDGCAIFVRSKKLHVEDVNTLYYSEGIGSGPSGHLALIAYTKQGKKKLAIVSTHLKWSAPGTSAGSNYALQEIKELIGVTKQKKKKAAGWIICGDFNVSPQSPVIRELERAGFRYAYKRVEQGTSNAHQRVTKLDYIFVSEALKAKPERIINLRPTTILPNQYVPSDHLPIIAIVSWK